MSRQIEEGGPETRLADSLAGECLTKDEQWADLLRRVQEHCALVDANIALINYERKLYGLDDL